MTTIWSPRHNWSSPYIERWSYRTDVLTAEDGTEQRVQLKVIPDRQDQLSCTTADARKSGILDALLFAGQDEEWLVPYWPGATVLMDDVVAGSSVVLNALTTDRTFGSTGVLYREGRQPESFTISGLTTSTVTAATLAEDWPLGSLVLPARIARWAADWEIDRLSAQVASMRATFDYEAGSDPGVSVLDPAELFPLTFSRREDPSDAYERRVERITSPTQSFQDYARTLTPNGRRQTSPIWLPNRATVLQLKQWFHGVRGMAIQFLLPTYQADLVPLGGLGTDTLTIARIGYADRLFPLGSRLTLAAFSPTGEVTQFTVTGATDMDEVEVLTLDAPVPADTVMLSYLLTVRLASDTLEIRWLSAEVAETVLEVVEV